MQHAHVADRLHKRRSIICIIFRITYLRMHILLSLENISLMPISRSVWYSCNTGLYHVRWCPYALSFQWRHNESDGVSSHQPHHCLLSRLFWRGSKKTSKLLVTSLCAGNSQMTREFPAQMASNAKNVSIWWRHYVVTRASTSSMCRSKSNMLGISFLNLLPFPNYWITQNANTFLSLPRHWDGYDKIIYQHM